MIWIVYMLVCICMHMHADEGIISRWKKEGVAFEQPQFVVIDPDVHIGKGSTIGCGVHVLGASTIGQGCSIGHFTIIKNCSIGENVKIHSHCVLENAIIESETEVGPFAHIEEKAHIQEKAVIGNFVQVKRSTVGPGSKAKHLAYLGDATLGEKVNIGAGVITCNYNGVRKQGITIDNNAFIGTNNSLVAPVYIGKGAMTAAGSTITRDVPDNTLAIGRSKDQINKLGYVPELLDRYRKEKESQIVAH